MVLFAKGSVASICESVWIEAWRSIASLLVWVSIETEVKRKRRKKKGQDSMMFRDYPVRDVLVQPWSLLKTWALVSQGRLHCDCTTVVCHRHYFLLLSAQNEALKLLIFWCLNKSCVIFQGVRVGGWTYVHFTLAHLEMKLVFEITSTAHSYLLTTVF